MKSVFIIMFIYTFYGNKDQLLLIENNKQTLDQIRIIFDSADYSPCEWYALEIASFSIPLLKFEDTNND